MNYYFSSSEYVSLCNMLVYLGMDPHSVFGILYLKDTQKQARMTRDEAACKECKRLLRKFPVESQITVRNGKSQVSSLILNGSIAEALYELHLISVHGMKK